MPDPKPLDPAPTSLPLRVARAGALVLALGACSTLVYREHRRANPEPARGGDLDPAPGAGEPTAATPDPSHAAGAAPVDAPGNGAFLGSSKSAAITTLTEWEDEEVVDDPAFLFSSKSAAIPVRGAGPGPATREASQGLLHSSKSIVVDGPVPEFVDEDGEPLFLFGSKSAPLELVETPAEATARPPGGIRANGKPVLLNSSKSLVIDPDYRRSLEEAARPPAESPTDPAEDAPPPTEPPAQDAQAPRPTRDRTPGESPGASKKPAGREW